MQVKWNKPQPYPAKYTNLGARFIKIDDSIYFEEIFPGSAADSIGLKPGMQLLGINGIALSMALQKVPDHLINAKYGSLRGQRSGDLKRIKYLFSQPIDSVMSITYKDLNGNITTSKLKFREYEYPESRSTFVSKFKNFLSNRSPSWVYLTRL